MVHETPRVTLLIATASYRTRVVSTTAARRGDADNSCALRASLFCTRSKFTLTLNLVIIARLQILPVLS